MARKKVAPEEEIVNAVGEETALGSVPVDTAPPDEAGADTTMRTSQRLKCRQRSFA